MPATPIELHHIEAAARVIAGEAVATPTHRLESVVGLDALWCKDETRQRTGSFKFRGAYHRLAAIPEADRDQGVVAVSSGNHGAAVAEAARRLGMRAVVHVPSDVAPAKRARMEQAGAELVAFDPGTADREGPAIEQADRTGATFVHPFEDPLVMAGQGTCAVELRAQVGALDALLVPMSGGGLMAGCASALLALDPDCAMVGVEPADGDDTRRSMAAGRPVMIDPPSTIADGLRVRRPGAATFAINRRLVGEVVTVGEREIVDAMRTLRGALDVTAEPSGAVALAAVLARPERWRGLRVGVIVSGGNIDPRRFAELTDLG